MLTRVEKARLDRKKELLKEVAQEIKADVAGLLEKAVFFTVGFFIVWFALSYLNVVSNNYSPELVDNIGDWNLLKLVIKNW